MHRRRYLELRRRQYESQSPVSSFHFPILSTLSWYRQVAEISLVKVERSTLVNASWSLLDCILDRSFSTSCCFKVTFPCIFDNPSRDFETIFRRNTLANSSVTISGSSCHIGLGSKVKSAGSFQGALLCCANIVESRTGIFRATSSDVCCNMALLRDRHICSRDDACRHIWFNLWVRSSERSCNELRRSGISWWKNFAFCRFETEILTR